MNSVPMHIVQEAPRKPRTDLFFTQLVKRSEGWIYRLALRITRNPHDAEEVRQEALLKMYRKLPQFEGRSRLKTWMYRIAVNEALMYLRKRRIHMPLDEALANEYAVADEAFHSSIEGPEAAYSSKELRKSLTRAIGGLRPKHRNAFLLRVVEQLSTSETANVLQISSAAVKARVFRARKQLRDYLNQAQTVSSYELSNEMPADKHVPAR